MGTASKCRTIRTASSRASRRDGAHRHTARDHRSQRRPCWHAHGRSARAAEACARAPLAGGRRRGASPASATGPCTAPSTGSGSSPGSGTRLCAARTRLFLCEAPAIVPAAPPRSPNVDRAEQPARIPRWSHRAPPAAAARRAAIGFGLGGLVLAAASSLALPWFTQLEIEQCAEDLDAGAPDGLFASCLTRPRSSRAATKPISIGDVALRYEDLRAPKMSSRWLWARSSSVAYATLVNGASPQPSATTIVRSLLERAVRRTRAKPLVEGSPLPRAKAGGALTLPR